MKLLQTLIAFNEAKKQTLEQDVAEGLNESSTINVIKSLISEFNKQMSGNPYFPMDFKGTGVTMWTRGDGSQYKDPGYIFIDRNLITPEDQLKWREAKAVEKFWQFLLTKGAKKNSDVSGEFGSDPHSPAVVLGKLIFVLNDRSIAWGSTSRLRNSSVWRQKQQGVAEGSEDKNAQQRKAERDKQRTASAQKARNAAERKGLTQDKDGTYYAKEGMAEGKVKLFTDPDYFGAEVNDKGFDKLPIVNIPTNRLVGFEPDSKMQDPKSKANVKKILAGLEKGDNIPPILVRKYKTGYQVLDGHHRFWAYKVAKKDSIPARVVDPKDIEEVGKQGVAEDSDKLQGTPVVSLSDFDDKDAKKDKYGRTVPKKLKKDDPRVKFHKEPVKKDVAEATGDEKFDSMMGKITNTPFSGSDFVNIGTAKWPLYAKSTAKLKTKTDNGSTHHVSGFVPPDYPAGRGATKGDVAVHHNRETYTHTGKVGTSFKTGEKSYEYRNEKDQRLWVSKSGHIVLDEAFANPQNLIHDRKGGGQGLSKSSNIALNENVEFLDDVFSKTFRLGDLINAKQELVDSCIMANYKVWAEGILLYGIEEGDFSEQGIYTKKEIEDYMQEQEDSEEFIYDALHNLIDKIEKRRKTFKPKFNVLSIQRNEDGDIIGIQVKIDKA